VGNPDEGPAKSAVGAEDTPAGTQPNRPARRGTLAAANASSRKRKGPRSDAPSAQRTARPADFTIRIAQIRAAVRATWVSRGFTPRERHALQQLARRVEELLGEDPAI
jgi:hypothetical protein